MNMERFLLKILKVFCLLLISSLLYAGQEGSIVAKSQSLYFKGAIQTAMPPDMARNVCGNGDIKGVFYLRRTEKRYPGTRHKSGKHVCNYAVIGGIYRNPNNNIITIAPKVSTEKENVYGAYGYISDRSLAENGISVSSNIARAYKASIGNICGGNLVFGYDDRFYPNKRRVDHYVSRNKVVMERCIIATSKENKIIGGNIFIDTDMSGDGIKFEKLHANNNLVLIVNSSINTGPARLNICGGRVEIASSAYLTEPRIFNYKKRVIRGQEDRIYYEVIEASSNTVIIAGGDLNHNDICGGEIIYNKNYMLFQHNGSCIICSHPSAQVRKAQTIYNTVVITGKPSDLSRIYGGRIKNVEGVIDKVTGNTLRIDQTKNVKVGCVKNFEKYEFILPNDVEDGDCILDIRHTPKRGGLVIKVENIKVENYNQGKDLKIILINVREYYSNNKFILEGRCVREAGRSCYIFMPQTELTVEETLRPGQHTSAKVIFTYHYVPEELLTTSGYLLNPQTRVLSEGAGASLAFIGESVDVLVREGIENAKEGVKEEGKGISGFVALNTNRDKYHTGSESPNISINGMFCVGGLAKGARIGSSKLTMGCFYENGEGKYETANDIKNGFGEEYSVVGNGKSQENGGGLFGRIDFANKIYTDISGRYGQVNNEFTSLDLKNIDKVEYEYCTEYVGMHVGGGYIYKISKDMEVDMSGRYYYTKMKGKEVEIPENEKIEFKDEKLSKVKIGARVINKRKEVESYIGVGYEYELEGKINATIEGAQVKAPNLGGGSGVVEGGFSNRIGKVILDINARAHGGVREGIDGMLKIKYII